MPTVLRVLHQIRRRFLIHRRGLIAVCVAAIAWSVVTTIQPPAARTETVWTATADLPSGTVLGPDDLVRRSFAVGTAPPAAHDLRSLVGRTLAAPLGEGQVATQTQTLGNSRLAGYPGMSAVPVRIPDADAVALLRTGDRIDLVGSDPQTSSPGIRVAEAATVVALPKAASSSSAPALTGRLVVLAVPTQDAVEVAAAASRLFLTVIWNR